MLLLNLLESMPSPRNVDGSYNVGDVAFDNVNGLGATPNNANIAYRGAVAWIKPSTFAKLATAAERGQTATELEKLMRAGQAIGTPMLDIEVHGDPAAPESVQVVGHEGRARSIAFRAINGDVYMPVQLNLMGIRARHLSKEFFAWVDAHGLQAERSAHVVDLGAQMYYWNDQLVKAS
jgi:hypothetical protein